LGDTPTEEGNKCSTVMDFLTKKEGERKGSLGEHNNVRSTEKRVLRPQKKKKKGDHSELTSSKNEKGGEKKKVNRGETQNQRADYNVCHAEPKEGKPTIKRVQWEGDPSAFAKSRSKTSYGGGGTR